MLFAFKRWKMYSKNCISRGILTTLSILKGYHVRFYSLVSKPGTHARKSSIKYDNK